MNGFEELKNHIAELEGLFKKLSEPKNASQSDEEYEADLYTNVFESYSMMSDIIDEMKHAQAALRKKYKVSVKEINQWIKESEEETPTVPTSTPEEPAAAVEPAAQLPEQTKVGLKKSKKKTTA